MKIRTIPIAICLFLSAFPGRLHAQWVTQSIHLEQGWNAVWLEVQPEPRDPATVFAGVPIEIAWMWNRQFDPVQFIDDPNSLKLENKDWLVFAPHIPVATNMGAVLGNHAYLLKNTSGAAFDWKVKGIPLLKKSLWIPDSLNLVGFQGSPTVPSFSALFQQDKALQGSPIFRLSTGGSWVVESKPSLSSPKDGEAFWVRSTGATTFPGLVNVVSDTGEQLDFGHQLPELSLTVANLGSKANEFLLKLADSEIPPLGSGNVIAGGVKLSIWRQDLANHIYGWFPLTNSISIGVLAPLGQARIRLSVRRRDFDPVPSSASVEPTYQSVLSVQAVNGSAAKWIPVTARSRSTANLTAKRGLRSLQAAASDNPQAGLWVGTAIINAVSDVGLQDDSPKSTPTELQFRLLLHVDASGQVRLLQRVYQMSTNGSPVLVTDETKLALFDGSLVKDGKQIGRRYSTIAFGFDQPQLMIGEFGNIATAVTCSITNKYDDPLNPFKHRFHPDHNNLSEDYRKVLPEGQESFTFIRALKLSFTSEDPQNQPVADYGTKTWGGIYRETISGVHQKAINAQGFFRLNRVSSVGILNNGL